MNDDSIMPFGKHKGKKLINVPASYLLHIYKENYAMQKDLKNYIEDNLDVLEYQMKEEAKYDT